MISMTRYLFAALIVICTSPATAIDFNTHTHRDGQTFLTWEEDSLIDGESYLIFRSDSEITAQDLPTMAPLFEVREGSSIAALERTLSPPSYTNFFVKDIRDGGTALPDNEGLLVWTTDRDQTTWYAIVEKVDGEARFADVTDQSITPAIAEFRARPKPLLVRESVGDDDRKARVWLQYMDLNNWNPTFPRMETTGEGMNATVEKIPGGYAFSYMVLDPIDYDPNRSYPVLMDFHGLGQRYFVDPAFIFDWPVIYIKYDDPMNSFWYGWSETHDYATGDIPPTGPIVNYTEARILRTLYDTIDDPLYHADEERVVATGHSMGGTAVVSLALRYPEIFAAAYASQPFTNPREQFTPGPVCQEPVPLGANNIERVYGAFDSQLPIKNITPYLGETRLDPAAANYQFNGMPVWDWANQIDNVSGIFSDRELPALMLDFGSRDCMVSFDTQSLDFLEALERQKVYYSAVTIPASHGWQNFAGVSPIVGPDDDFPGSPAGCDYSLIRCIEVSRGDSFPSFENNSGNATFDPDLDNRNYYNKNISWAAPWFEGQYNGAVIDGPYQWQATLFAIAPDQPAPGTTVAADVTPRRVKLFRWPPGTEVAWTAISLLNGEMLVEDQAVVDTSGLVTAAQVPITPGGTILTLQVDIPSTWLLD